LSNSAASGYSGNEILKNIGIRKRFFFFQKFTKKKEKSFCKKMKKKEIKSYTPLIKIKPTCQQPSSKQLILFYKKKQKIIQ
jgi:hypothetical protein